MPAPPLTAACFRILCMPEWAGDIWAIYVGPCTWHLIPVPSDGSGYWQVCLGTSYLPGTQYISTNYNCFFIVVFVHAYISVFSWELSKHTHTGRVSFEQKSALFCLWSTQGTPPQNDQEKMVFGFVSFKSKVEASWTHIHEISHSETNCFLVIMTQLLIIKARPWLFWTGQICWKPFFVTALLNLHY